MSVALQLNPAKVADLMAENERLRERCAQLETALGLRTLFAPQLKLTRAEAVVLGVILAREIAATETLCLALEGLRRDDATRPVTGTLHVLIARIRRKLQPHDIAIHSVIRQGYFLVSDDKAKLAALVAGAPVKAGAMFHGKQA